MLNLKSITSFTLVLLILSFSMAGTILLFEQLAIKIAMREKLEQSQLLTLPNLSQNDFIWVDEGKEMSVHGQLFDVKEYTQNQDGSVSAKGLFDNEEDDLLALLKGCVDDTANNNAAHKILSDFFQQVLACNYWPPLPTHLSSANNKTKFYFVAAHLKWQLKEIQTPPPQS